MVLMPGMVITPGHLYGGGAVGKRRLTLALPIGHKTAGGGWVRPPPLLTSYQKIKVLVKNLKACN